MKNHFIFSYAGNKRDEVEKIYKNLNLTNITDIYEPFCGTSALSYYISTQKPKEYTYHINDNNKHLIKLYNILKSKKETDKLNKEYNEITKTINKEIYDKLDKNTLIGNLIHNKIYVIRPGLFKLDYKYKEIDFNEYPICKFLRNEKVIITNSDATDLINEIKDKENNFIFLDPPYISTCNSFYLSPTLNIYEYLSINDINKYKCKLVIVLENIWIIKLLFKDKHFIEYEKLYQTSKKKTTHLMIANYEIKENKDEEEEKKPVKIKKVKKNNLI